MTLFQCKFKPIDFIFHSLQVLFLHEFVVVEVVVAVAVIVVIIEVVAVFAVVIVVVVVFVVMVNSK